MQPARPGRVARLARSPWLPTLLQPLALVVVVLVGRAVVGPTPGTATERVLIGLASALTLPGLVVYLAAAWRARPADDPKRADQRHDGARRDGQRRAGQTPSGQTPSDQTPSDQTPSDQTTDRPGSRVFDLAGRAIAWGLGQAVLDLALALVLMAVPVGEWWQSVPALPIVGGLVLALVALLVIVTALGVGAIRAGLTGTGVHWSMRGAMLSLGLALVGLPLLAVPYAVLGWSLDLHVPRGIGAILALNAFALRVDSGAAALVWALRAATVMIDAGLFGLVVLGPLAFWNVVIRRREPAPRETKTSSRIP